jgi:hypothetical protein
MVPDMKHTQADLELAIFHVKETEWRVAEQRSRIERLRAAGQPTEGAENLLVAFQESLASMLVHLGNLTDPGKGGNLSD